MKSKGNVIRIDIETELKAIDAGECGSCRVGLTHRPDKSCYTKSANYKRMGYCGKCNYLFNLDIFKVCPVHKGKKNGNHD